MQSEAIFSDLLIGSALTVQIGLAVPIVMHFSEQEETTRFKFWFMLSSLIATAVLSTYLIAAIDYRAYHKKNVWDVVVVTLMACCVFIPLLLKIDKTRRPSGPYGGITVSEELGSGSSAPAIEPTGMSRDAIETPTCTVVVCQSSAEYADRIIRIERNAVQIDRMVKRVSAIFKDPTAVEAIATRRFGAGSPQAEAYRREHRERHRIFIENVSAGTLRCREVYNLSELKRYFGARMHGLNVMLERDTLRRTAEEWLRSIAEYQDYYVGLTEDPIPLKYQVIDQTCAVIHEAVGSLDGQRVNGIVVQDPSAVGIFQQDFEHVWERIPPKMRDRAVVIRYIRRELMPLLQDGKEPNQPVTKGERQ
jgi:hypothetical protein